jgi:transposase
MCFLKKPLLQTLKSTIQKSLSLSSSTHLYLNSLSAPLSTALNNSNSTLIKFLTRLQNPYGVYEQRLKKYNKKKGFPGCPQGNRDVDSWRYEDCFRRREKMKGRMYDERRFEERRRGEKDMFVGRWMGEMEGMSWDRKARYCRNEIVRW